MVTIIVNHHHEPFAIINQFCSPLGAAHLALFGVQLRFQLGTFRHQVAVLAILAGGEPVDLQAVMDNGYTGGFTYKNGGCTVMGLKKWG